MVPVERSVPMAAKAFPPCMMMGRIFNKGLHVLNNGGPAEQTDLGGKWRLVPRLSTFTLNGVHERGLFAADVGPGPDSQLDVEAHSGAEDIGTQERLRAAFANGMFETAPGQRILAANVQVTLLASGGEAGDDHGLDQCVWIAFHQHTIFESAGLGFIRVADQISRQWSAENRLPLLAAGESGAAAPHQLRFDHFANHRGRPHFEGAPQGRKTASSADIRRGSPG